MIGVILIAAGFSQSGPGPAGHWEGTVQLPDRELQIAIDLAKDDKGAWTGTFGQITQNVRDIPLGDITVDGSTVKFRIAAPGGNAPTFECGVQSPSVMNCTLSTPGGSVTAPMKRTGDAKVNLPKTSSAVTGELEGNWEGSLETPNGNYRLILHFKNQPDKTVKATLDSPDQGAMDLPVTDVVQAGADVEFKLRLVNGGYKGTMNKEATQLSGEWSQSGNSLPLVLKKAVAK
jgi:hypothetical protein